MGRPRKFTDEQFKRTYNQTESTNDLAAALGITSVSAYKHLRRLGLTSKTPEGRPDLRSFDDEQLAAAHSKSESYVQVAAALGCSPQTARKHAERLGLKTFGHRGIDMAKALKIFNEYQAEVTVRELARTHETTASVIRTAFDRAINQIWYSNVTKQASKNLPVPDCHGQIKLFNLFSKHPRSVGHSADQLVEFTGLSKAVVERYLRAMHNARIQHTSTPPSQSPADSADDTHTPNTGLELITDTYADTEEPDDRIT